ncbi:DUF4180 domain-containing protein [Streptomyces sp. NPDC050619]|uniref:DUF4180 domain-containing protein n=1 Tax=Streptomyces sp. NPDC050619 TaxID=3157214 RepID=UPI0034215D35
MATDEAAESLDDVVRLHGVRLAVVGDVSRHVSGSTALRDFVHETNHGGHIWFLADFGALDEKLRTTR